MIDTEAASAANAVEAENLVAMAQPAMEVQAALDTVSAAGAGLCTAQLILLPWRHMPSPSP
jgi:hypothetical protein